MCRRNNRRHDDRGIKKAKNHKIDADKAAAENADGGVTNYFGSRATGGASGVYPLRRAHAQGRSSRYGR
jgi:hypothetical protein